MDKQPLLKKISYCIQIYKASHQSKLKSYLRSKPPCFCDPILLFYSVNKQLPLKKEKPIKRPTLPPTKLETDSKNDFEQRPLSSSLFKLGVICFQRRQFKNHLKSPYLHHTFVLLSAARDIYLICTKNNSIEITESQNSDSEF